jgi:hypothetical protein
LETFPSSEFVRGFAARYLQEVEGEQQEEQSGGPGKLGELGNLKLPGFLDGFQVMFGLGIGIVHALRCINCRVVFFNCIYWY